MSTTLKSFFHKSIARNFTTHQIIHFIYIAVFLFAILHFLIAQLIRVTPTHSIILGALVFLIYFGTAFSKKGIGVFKETLYKTYYSFGLFLFKSKIKQASKTSYSILTFRKAQKYAFFSAAKPDLASTDFYFDFYLLNKKHTIKELIISVKNEDHKTMITDFLDNNTNLTKEIYSPDFS